MSNHPTAFVIGPPAAGKSTIARAVAGELNRTFRTIDDWTPRAVSMKDAEVDLALSQLFGATRPTNEIVEFCHHAYETLIKADTYPVFTYAPKVVVTAPLSVCSARNLLRRSPVQADYVARAWRSSEHIARHLATRDPGRTLIINTSCYSVDAATAAVVAFLTMKWRSL